MKKIYVLIIISCITITGFTQSFTERLYVKGGNDARENFMKEVFYLPAFEDGIVEYKNGERYRSTLNYNKALGRIQFIDQKGDTLTISNEESINYIMIGNYRFFYLPECMQEIKSAGNVKLLKNERIRIADFQKTGGFGIPNSSASIESVNKIDYRQINIDESLLLVKLTSFYIQYAEKQAVPASQKNILNIFRKNESAIKEFIRSKNIDFEKEDKLIELAGFLSQL